MSSFLRPWRAMTVVAAVLALAGCTTIEGTRTTGWGGAAGAAVGAAGGAAACGGGGWEAAVGCGVGGALVGLVVGNEVEGVVARLNRQRDGTLYYNDPQTGGYWQAGGLPVDRACIADRQIDAYGRMWVRLTPQCVPDGGYGYSASPEQAFPPAPAAYAPPAAAVLDEVETLPPPAVPLPRAARVEAPVVEMPARPAPRPAREIPEERKKVRTVYPG